MFHDRVVADGKPKPASKPNVWVKVVNHVESVQETGCPSPKPNVEDQANVNIVKPIQQETAELGKTVTGLLIE